jgi:hypothetical protein
MHTGGIGVSSRRVFIDFRDLLRFTSDPECLRLELAALVESLEYSRARGAWRPGGSLSL